MNVVWYANVLVRRGISIKNPETQFRIPVTRLSYTPYIDNEPSFRVHSCRLSPLGVDDRDVRMTDETDAFGEGMESFACINITDDVMPFFRFKRRGVGEEDVPSRLNPGKRLEKRLVLLGKCAEGPHRREAGMDGELIGDSEVDCSSVVISKQNRRTSLADEVKALIRISTISYDITQADDLVDGFPFNCLKSALKCLEVGVNIGDDCQSHGEVLPLGLCLSRESMTR